jgi:hypothetical protein
MAQFLKVHPIAAEPIWVNAMQVVQVEAVTGQGPNVTRLLMANGTEVLVSASTPDLVAALERALTGQPER